MEITYLKSSQEADRLILIFSGWSTLPDFYRHLQRRDWDLAVVHDYTSFSLPDIPEKYHTVYLYAWSFGVTVADNFPFTPHRVTRAFAIAGTPQGIDAVAGIPPAVFQATMLSLNPRNLRKFHNRILTHSLPPIEKEQVMNRFPADPDIPRLQQELASIESLTHQPEKPFPGIHWNRAYITADDLIFPAEAQRTAWEDHPCKPEITILQSGHYPDFNLILSQTIPDREELTDSFAASVDTYRSQATAQAKVAERLAELLKEALSLSQSKALKGKANGKPEDYLNRNEKNIRLLEIGSGNGLFSSCVARILPADKVEATFVDLYRPARNFGLFAGEEYVAEDAETWLEEQPDASFDIIVSSSALQWFVNPRRFFANVRRLLKPGGFMAVSSFVEGTLRQLDAVRPAPLNYHSPEALSEMAQECFPTVRTEVLDIDLTFPNARGALLHLRDTGVTAGPATPLPLLLRALRPASASAPTLLSYRAVLLTASLLPISALRR